MALNYYLILGLSTCNLNEMFIKNIFFERCLKVKTYTFIEFVCLIANLPYFCNLCIYVCKHAIHAY